MRLSIPSNIGLILGFVVLAGCATLNEEQCRLGDWKSIGFEDGIEGYSTKRLEKHYEACAKYGIQPQKTLYHAGRLEGIKNFCTYKNGLAEGKAGRKFKKICPAESLAKFREGYEKGLAIGRIEGDLRELNHDITALENELDREPDLIRKMGLRNQIRILQRQKDRLYKESARLQ